MNLTSKISEKIKNISVEENIIHIGEVKKFDGNIVYTDPFPAPIGSLCLIHDCNKKKSCLKLLVLMKNIICSLY